ncbi:MAG: DUF1641 domain-containing protein, partial [Bacteroidales bacterium]|nr:DUF1641 domain-containing protein [Bacteroidales bacterium]
QIELHPEELTELSVSFLRNIKNFNVVMNSFESIVDLGKDISPIINESIIDFTKAMAQFEAKGYFEFFKSLALIGDELIQQFSMEDMNQIRKKLPAIVEIMKQLTDDKTLVLAQKGMNALQKTDVENPPEMGIWQMIKSMNDPSMKKSLGLVISMSKNMY